MNAAARAPVAGTRWVLFCLDAGRFALPLATVERIVRAAGITPLPLAPESVLGAIDVAGDILPVFDLRRRFKLPPRELRLSDQFIVARSDRRRMVLAVDAALGVRDDAGLPAIDSARLEPGLDSRHSSISGVLSLEDGLVLIQDLERLLSPDEDHALEAALAAMRESGTVGRAR
jgi:purine-binding chemotaxis protein CheW